MAERVKGIASSLRRSHTVVEVNVGGTVFKLGKSVLNKPDLVSSALRGLIFPSAATEDQSRDASGIAFIDRDHRHFGTILEYIRSDGDVSILPPCGTKGFAELKQEAEYYKLTRLVKKMYQIEVQAEKKLHSGDGGEASEKDNQGAKEEGVESQTDGSHPKEMKRSHTKHLSLSGSLRDLKHRLTATVSRRTSTLDGAESSPRRTSASNDGALSAQELAALPRDTRTPTVPQVDEEVSADPNAQEPDANQRTAGKSEKRRPRRRSTTTRSRTSSSQQSKEGASSAIRDSRRKSSQTSKGDASSAIQDSRRKSSQTSKGDASLASQDSRRKSSQTSREDASLVTQEAAPENPSYLKKPKAVYHGRKLAYNIVVVGASGSGKSSIVNTFVGKQVCMVGGGQTVGTRSDTVKLGRAAISDTHYISFLDTQGLGADTKVTDAELITQLMQATDLVMEMEIVNHVLITLDLTARATRERISNQLMLVKLFQGMREACFLCFTKWNTSGAMAEWNTPLREWIKRHRKAQNIDDILEDPPSFGEIYSKYCAYVLEAMGDTTASGEENSDSTSFANMGVFLSFFEARVLWVYNLDEVQMEDRKKGELQPYVERLFTFYRHRCLESLDNAVASVPTDNEEFVRFTRSNPAERGEYLRSLLNQEGGVGPVVQLGDIDDEATKRVSLKSVKHQFSQMTESTTERIATRDYRAKKHPWDKAFVAADKINTVTKSTGCVLQ